MSLLRVSLIGFGIVFCSVYGLFQINLFGGWAWSPAQPEYQLMIVGIYLVMGLMMIFQAEDGIRDVERSRGLGDVYKRQIESNTNEPPV